MKTDQTPLESLAAKTQAAWAESGNSLEAFPAISTKILNDLKYNGSLQEFNNWLTEWLVDQPNLPEQVNVHNTFGQPPITVFNNGRFVIDLYIWRGCDTSIHSHGFRGAFRVLHGQSLHEVFNVETETVVAADVSLTRLHRPRLEILSVGDVRTIQPDQALTHRVIHLENPTVTLCIKTINEPGVSQWHHFESGVAIKKRHVDPSLLKKAYYFQYLLESDETLAASFLKKWLAPIDLSTRMNLCEDLSMGVCDLPESSVQQILECACDGFETTEWFRRFQKASMEQNDDIAISAELSPALRLAIHFANTGWKYSEAEAWLGKTKTPSKTDLTRLVLNSLDEDNPAVETQRQRWAKFIEN